VDLPDSPHLNFSVVLSPTTRCPSMAASLRSFISRSGLFPGRAVSRLRPSGFWASPFIRKLARTPGRIEFLTYGPTDSPPVALHPTFGGHDSSVPSVTQLPLAFNQSSVWLRGISPPLQMRSRAHECGGLPPPWQHDERRRQAAALQGVVAGLRYPVSCAPQSMRTTDTRFRPL